MRIADCGLRIAKLPKELETRPRSRAVATGERREEMRIAECGLRNCRKSLKPGRDQERWRRAKGERKCGLRNCILPKELETKPCTKTVVTGERQFRNPHSEIRISLVETVIHWPRTSVELQDGAIGA
jgi:hypothetical protein